MEHKFLDFATTEVKFGLEGGLVFKGYASKFDGVDSYGDTIVQGAYKDTLLDRERPVALRWSHYGPVIGKFTSIKEDTDGLWVEGELTKGHSVAEDAAALLRHGAISGLSIGYISKQDSDNHPHNGRKLEKIELIEISVVEEPADNMARVDTVKNMLENSSDLKSIEAVLRQEFSLSRKESTVIVSAVKKALQSDSEKLKDDELVEKLKIFNLKL